MPFSSVITEIVRLIRIPVIRKLCRILFLIGIILTSYDGMAETKREKKYIKT